MKKIVYDLDGTLIKFNTFKVWIVISFIIPLFSFKMDKSLFISRLIYRRINKNLDRVSFKKELLIFQSHDEFWLKVGNLYGSLLCRFFLRTNLINKVKNENKEEKEVKYCLATAAPDLYVNNFSKEIGLFDVVLSTCVLNGNMYELLGLNKKIAVEDNFSESPDILYTDHSDDIPLAKITDFTYLVNPEIHCLRKFELEESIDFILLEI